MKGYRKSIWITPEMEKIINTAPIELGFNAKLRHVLCGESPGESPIHEGESQNASGDAPNTSGDTQNASGDAPNTQTDSQNTEMDIQNMKMDIQNAIDRLEVLEMWKMDVE